MENKNEFVDFDPGYAPVVTDSIGQIGYIYYIFCAVSDKKLKRINFPHTLRKLEKHLEVNISFYLGCLLWAFCISDKNAKIEGNKLLGEEASEEEYTKEINFLIKFIEVDIVRDCKYYLNKNYEPDSRYLPILKAYKDFLILNQGFVNCFETNQIILPNYLKKPCEKELSIINQAIKDAIAKKNLCLLFNYYDLIF